MFDDPKRELQRMDEALREAGRQEQEEREALADLKDLWDEPLPGEASDDEEWPRQVKALVGDEEEEVPIRNFANGYGRMDRTPPEPERRAFPDDDLEDLEDLERRAVTYRPRPKAEEPAKAAGEEPEPKGVGCLPLVALLELLGIMLLLLWWVRWLS